MGGPSAYWYMLDIWISELEGRRLGSVLSHGLQYLSLAVNQMSLAEGAGKGV